MNEYTEKSQAAIDAALGLRDDVLRVAKWLIDNNTFHDISVAYDLAYQHCTEQIDAS